VPLEPESAFPPHELEIAASFRYRYAPGRIVRAVRGFQGGHSTAQRRGCGGLYERSSFHVLLRLRYML
jgi:hypothetical protein